VLPEHADEARRREERRGPTLAGDPASRPTDHVVLGRHDPMRPPTESNRQHEPTNELPGDISQPVAAARHGRGVAVALKPSERSRLLVFSLPVLAACAIAPAGAPRASVETPRTEAAVRAIEDHWLRAEGTGDVEYLRRLLLPEYRSVSARGEAITKDAILNRAARNRASGEGMRAIEAYLAAHPTEEAVTLRDDVAIVSFFDPRIGVEKGVRSSDVFVHVDGAWHALYSQHCAGEPASERGDAAVP
jgi:hypothetical protein